MSEFFFRRYRNGQRMAEDVVIEREETLEDACVAASRMAAQYKDGTTLVYDENPVRNSESETYYNLVADNARLRAELAAEKKRAWALRYDVIDLEMDKRELRAALEPFAAMRIDDYEKNTDKCLMTAGVWGCPPTMTFELGNLRHARAVLDETGGRDE